jgi:hypothetical protein
VNKPLYILAAVPQELSKLTNFFDFSGQSVARFLEKPGRQRAYGWDLETLDRAKIIKGEYLEVKNGESKIINIYEDGTLVFRMVANEDLLGWGREEAEFEKNPRLNPMAIIESTYNFVVFYKKLLDKYFEKKPATIKFRLYIKNCKKLYLLPHGLRSTTWKFDSKSGRKYAEDDNLIKITSFTVEEVESNYEHVAYELVRSFYLLFGLTEDQIPYVGEENKKKIVDINKIINFLE